jgi:hypothetical protein
MLLFVLVEDGNEKKKAAMGRILGTITEDDGSKSCFLDFPLPSISNQDTLL